MIIYVNVMLIYVNNIEKYNFKNFNLCKFYAYFMINDVNNIEIFFHRQTNRQTNTSKLYFGTWQNRGWYWRLQLQILWNWVKNCENFFSGFKKKWNKSMKFISELA